MDEIKIRELLRAERPLTPEEQALLDDWYERFPEYGTLTFESAAEKKRIGQEMKAKVFSGIDKSRPLLKGNTIKLRWARHVAAAVFLILLGVGVAMYWNPYTSRRSEAVLAYKEEVAPLGKQNKQVVLPDGSTVWLLAGSTLRYPEAFPEGQRPVELVNGMAFFSVAHNPQSPFTVTAPGDVRTTVLGTSFNITGYEESDHVTVSVRTGRVNVGSSQRELGVITPDQQIVYTKSSGASRQQNVDTRMLTTWMEGDIVFSNSDLGEVAQIIESVYQVKVVYDKAATSGLRFNFQFRNDAPLRKPMDIIKDLGALDYRIHNDTIILTPAQ